MESLWEQEVKMPVFPKLLGNTDTDVLIIGGGIAGILCAWQLQQAGVDCLLVEADRIAGGVTGKTTAKIMVQHGLIYGKLAKRYGLDAARNYYRANRDALEGYRELCRDLDCDFESQPSFAYSLGDRQKLEEEARILDRIGAPVVLTRNTALPFPAAGAVGMADQAQFHPLKFLAAVAKDLPIYQQTPVRQLLGTVALTDRATIRAKRVVIATHFPILNKHGSYFLKMYQHRSYVLALEGVPPLSGMYVDEGADGMSFRSHGDTLLLGGGGHRTGKQGSAWEDLRSFAQRYYPQAKERACWATQDCMTLDGMPYIGPYSAGTKGLYVATGFQKWGMTSSMVAASVLCSQLQGKNSPYGALFDPSRSVLHPQLLVNAGEALLSWGTPAKRRCPHLGCALKWNPQEHSWDCPCHGSRFSEDGQLLDNPATGDLPGERQ